MIYDFRVKDIVELLIDLLIKDLDQLRLIKREKTDNVITFINVISKIRYDNKHKIINLKSLTYLRLHYNYFIFDINFKLFNQRVDLFKIFNKIKNLVYKLKLSEIIRIHSIILIAQLKFISDLSKDFYHRALSSSSLIEKEEFNIKFSTKNPLYEIDRLIDKRDTEKNIKYLIY